MDFIPKTKIEIAVDDDRAEVVVDTIQTTANTDSIGDGKIFVCELTEVVRIRTGERGSEAL